ncbi:HEPN domain-containing protein [Lysobacter capsici]|uniref:HEPN domain-containing protein n=1 Tax=Lysobacter capsici TaxID=435897 RepID=UPI001C00075B|nr:HEPN domain-containing protein [Lysobacter capsici]QWF18149.1 hypothetical protein KME82_05115 [Lysobacter capsici]
MALKMTPGIEINAVAKAMESVLPKLRKLDRASEGADDALNMLIFENEKLGAAFYQSPYTAHHIDWQSAIDLILGVLNADSFTDSIGFARELDTAVKATATQRDYVVVMPLAFANPFGFGRRKQYLARPFMIRGFQITPPAESAAALNRYLAPLHAHDVQEDLFAHQVTQSQNALSMHPLVIFEVHGSFGSLRRQLDPDVRHLIGLIELFGRVFSAEKTVFANNAVSNHMFYSNKRTGSLDRIPQWQPLTVSLPLSRSLITAIRRPEMMASLDLLLAGNRKGLVGRLRNALDFFTRAVNERNPVTRLLFFVIAMEAIFSRDKHAPIRVTLADYAAILCFKADERRTVHADLLEIYDARSAIVHNGVSHVDTRLTDKSEALAARAIYCSLLLAHKVKDGTATHEDRFFERLRNMKIGIESNPVRSPLWRGYGLPAD